MELRYHNPSNVKKSVTVSHIVIQRQKLLLVIAAYIKTSKMAQQGKWAFTFGGAGGGAKNMLLICRAML